VAVPYPPPSRYQPPGPDDLLVRALLERNAAEHPDQEFITFEDGSRWSRRDGLAAAYAAGNVLRDAGVQSGDRVLIFLPNGPEFLRAWWGATTIGATVVPVNLAFRASALRHLLQLAKPDVLIVGEQFRERIDEIGGGAGHRVIDPAALAGGSTDAPPRVPVHPGDPHALVLTSGTTGPSKLAIASHLHMYLGGSHLLVDWGCTADDVFLLDLPLFHMAGSYMTVACLASRTRLAVRSAPSMTGYWEVARDTGATVAVVVSTMAQYFTKQPERAADREHRLRLALSAPLPANVKEFQDRFGITDMVTAYGMTEIPSCLTRRPGTELLAGYCGRARPGFECRIVDEHDVEVEIGQVGEFVLRTDQPGMVSVGYLDNPEATANAWRNGWFHSGDLMRRDPCGNYFYVDRNKDALRRRGENISSHEVEAEVIRHPGVAEVACVPVRVEGEVDDEVKVWVVPAGELDFADLLRHCVDTLPHFAVPRYFEPIEALPKTASAKVQKFALRERGNGPDTWDREAHGYRVTRTGLRRD
jgi:crotonobetaine/carnitine-CoA ligase